MGDGSGMRSRPASIEFGFQLDRQVPDIGDEVMP